MFGLSGPEIEAVATVSVADTIHSTALFVILFSPYSRLGSLIFCVAIVFT